MLFSLTNPQIALLMMGLFLFMVLLGFPIAFTLLAMGVAFGYFAYFDWIFCLLKYSNTALLLF